MQQVFKNFIYMVYCVWFIVFEIKHLSFTVRNTPRCHLTIIHITWSLRSNLLLHRYQYVYAFLYKYSPEAVAVALQ